MRFPILTVDGNEYMIGGSPLVSKEKLVKLYPEMEAAFDRHADEKLPALERGEAMVEAAARIVKVFNPNVSTDDLLLDRYTINKILDIWDGTFDESAEDKKKISENIKSDTEGQE